MAPKSSGGSNQRAEFGQRETFTGWKVGVTVSSVLAMVVLIVNVDLTIWAGTTYSVGKDGLGTIYAGKCGKTKSMSLWIHLGINALGSILLGASNYCMQVLSSPTRAEIDQQHSKRDWMDIGLPSVRNLRKIARPRVVMWCILGLTSIPLHLLYNSAVFTTIRANAFTALLVTPEFLQGGKWTVPLGGDIRDQTNIIRIATTNTSTFQTLDRSSCTKTYDLEYVTEGSDVIAVTETHNSSNSVLFTRTYQKGNEFFKDLSYNDDIPDGADIAYCLSLPVGDGCDLQFSLHIMIVIIVCNLIKSITMGLIVWKLRAPTLVTVGDAVSSFLEIPDASTKGMCLTTKADILKGAWNENRVLKTYRPVRNFWFGAASTRRWLICNALYFGTLCVAGSFLSKGLKSQESSAGDAPRLKAIYEMGLGTVTSNSMIGGGFSGMISGALLQNVLIANAAQVVLSFLYLTYNGIFTCMLNANEWSQYARHRKGLRVTSPPCHQRSTYYLQLPYTYALPLQAICGTLHWLLSQSIFLARIQWYKWDRETVRSISACGYSCIALIFLIIASATVVLGGVAMGFRRYPPGIPMAAGCSAVISAACHPPPSERENAASQPLMWGVIPGGQYCSFSADLVGVPVEGNAYLGQA